MTATRVLVIAFLLTLGLAASPLAAPALATHSCIEDMPCYPHPPNDGPKGIIQYVGDTVRCLILVQPPTACI